MPVCGAASGPSGGTFPSTTICALHFFPCLSLVTPRYCELVALLRFARATKLVIAAEPWCSNYGGHQFGSWAGQLGDGRALSLGQLQTPAGASWELQLKGAGPTPFSRFADGLAVGTPVGPGVGSGDPDGALDGQDVGADEGTPVGIQV